MKNAFTTTALILVCGAAFAGTPISGEFSPSAPSAPQPAPT